MTAKRTIKINRKKKEPVVEEENPITTAIESKMEGEEQVMFTRSQLKGEIVGKGGRTVVQQPRGRIKFEAQLAAVPMFKLPEDIRRYLTSRGLPTTVWKWDKEKIEKRKIDVEVIEKLKKFLSSMS